MTDLARRQQRTETLAKLDMGGLCIRIERRNGSEKLYARAFLQGKLVVKSTGETTLGAASKVATDWYLEQRDRIRRGEHLHGRMFSDVAENFLKHIEQRAEMSAGQRRNYRDKWNLLKPHFANVRVTDVDTSFLVRLRDTRLEDANGLCLSAAQDHTQRAWRWD